MLYINWNANNPVVKAASLTYCNVILIGSLLAYASVFTFIERPTVAKCVLQPLLIVSSFVLIFGLPSLLFSSLLFLQLVYSTHVTLSSSSVILKNFRIWRIFSNPFQSLEVNLTNTKLALLELLYLSINMVTSDLYPYSSRSSNILLVLLLQPSSHFLFFSSAFKGTSYDLVHRRSPWPCLLRYW